MSNAYRTGAAMARLSVAGLGGLGAAPKKGKKGKKRAAPRQTSGLKRVVNAFIAGTSDREGCKWDVDAGTGSCAYATDGNELRVHGVTVARRTAPGGFFQSKAAKQIKVCAEAKYALDTKDAKERRENSDLLGAVNAIMDTVRTGVRVREVKDYDKGFRTVLSAFRFGGGGAAAIVGGVGRSACVTVELTEEMRARALSNALAERYADDLLALKKEVELPFKDKRKPLSRDELLAVLANVQREVATGGDPVAAFQKIRDDIKAGKSIMPFPF